MTYFATHAETFLTAFGALLAIVLGLAFVGSKETTNQLTHVIEISTKREYVRASFNLSAKIAERAFQKRLISIRAFVVSIISSMIFYVCYGAIALATTPWLSDYSHKFPSFPLPFPHMKSHYYGLESSNVAIILVLFAEYIYVSKTRYILRRYILKNQNDPKVPSFFLFFLFDLVTTFFLLFLTYPFVIILTLYCLQILNPSIDISKCSLIIVGDFFKTNETSYTFGQLAAFQFNSYQLLSFLQISYICFWILYEEIANHLSPYFIVDISTYSSIYQSSIITLQSPFTTFAASAFSTTIWISLVSIVLGIASVALRLQHSTARTILFLHVKDFWKWIITIWLIIIIIVLVVIVLT